jgi:hypothetical protein
LPGGLVGILAAVVEIAVLAVLHTRQDLPLRGAITFQLVRNEHPWDVRQALEQLADELLRGLLVAPALHENVQDGNVLIHRPPQIMPFFVDYENDFVQVPLVTRLCDRVAAI